MQEEVAMTLAAVADSLNRTQKSDSATIGYDVFADALVWSDEYPDDLPGRTAEYNCLRFVLRYRTALVTDMGDQALEEYWILANRLFPRWPGFSMERCSPSVELQVLLKQLREEQDELLEFD